ncbi:hypothetical protein NSB25_26760 [Acetatifactor muris]|uniref:HK97 gp10 family phage protein n=1 Tax=Acetatifactor muris TaxID=879566 RepID=A0A2K4ZPG0_9FIRM|nr:hypothetical protein [Acetatifactor muris]MCR2050836.1 hypothetical protein [Acetatifactor muris]SOY32350.1 hypothetical protein AMURIS_05108 [Acetatifactor muris]
MAIHINNMKDLEKALMPTMAKMVDTLAERVYETLNYFLQEYYDDYDPKSYRRQHDFLRSAVKVESKIKGNKAVATVFIDTDSMDNYYNATGEQVAKWANQGTHGGLVTGSKTPHVWDDTLDETVNNGELLKLAVEYLKSKGISVRT